MAEPTAIFSLRYAGSVGYYAAMLRYGSIVLDTEERFCKKKQMSESHGHCRAEWTSVVVYAAGKTQ